MLKPPLCTTTAKAVFFAFALKCEAGRASSRKVSVIPVAGDRRPSFRVRICLRMQHGVRVRCALVGLRLLHCVDVISDG